MNCKMCDEKVDEKGVGEYCWTCHCAQNNKLLDMESGKRNQLRELVNTQSMSGNYVYDPACGVMRDVEPSKECADCIKSIDYEGGGCDIVRGSNKCEKSGTNGVICKYCPECGKKLK